MKEFIEKVEKMMESAGLHRKHLKKVFEDSLRSKQELNEMLELNEENSFRKQLSIEMTDAEFNAMYPFVMQVFKAIPGWSGDFKPTTGKITVGRDQVNITKFLSKAITDKTIPDDYKAHLMAKMNIDRYSSKGESQIVPKLGELLSNKNSSVVVVSTNPFDFFTCSAGDYKYAAFKSCFRPGGEYFNGCNSLARDSFSTIAYKASADKLDYKHGRAWMFVLDKIVAQTKSYGTFTANERKVAREYVEQQLAKKHEFDSADYKHHVVTKWKKKSNSNVLYFDDYSIDLRYRAKDYPNGFSDAKVPEIRFSDAVCLKCGKETQYPTQGVCGKCSGNYRSCKECDADLYGGREVYINGEYFCRECVERTHEICGHCGNYHRKGTGMNINGVLVCPTCVRDRFFFCNHCNTYHNKNDVARHTMATVAGTQEMWCEKCFKKDGSVCSDCGKKHPKTYVQAIEINKVNQTICNDCIGNYAVCDKCGIHFKGGHKTSDGIVCRTCFDLYDFCTHCTEFVPKESIQFDGEAISCGACAEKRKSTGGTNEKYLLQVGATIAAVQAAELAVTGDTVAILQQMMEDREKNGFQEGDILKIVADKHYHGYKPGTLVVNCKRYEGTEGAAYCTFRDGIEWFVKADDVEFVRPAMVVGDTFTKKGSAVARAVDGVMVRDNDMICYVSGGDAYKCEDCVPTDIIDIKALTSITYKVGEVLQIVNNVSGHPFNFGDKVKIMYSDARFGLIRYVVKKGTKFGIIWGSLADLVKPAKEIEKSTSDAPIPAPKKRAVKPKVEDDIAF